VSLFKANEGNLFVVYSAVFDKVSNSIGERVWYQIQQKWLYEVPFERIDQQVLPLLLDELKLDEIGWPIKNSGN
jgi:hypothetical protein